MTALFAYEHAANRQVLAALRAAPEALERARAVFAHVLAAQRVWTERIRDGASPTPVWPSLTLDTCEVWLSENEARLGAVLGTPEALGDRVFRYHSTSGVGYESTVGDVLQHLLLHGAYHRGQIALLLRGAGLAPPATDYVYHTRLAL